MSDGTNTRKDQTLTKSSSRNPIQLESNSVLLNRNEMQCNCPDWRNPTPDAMLGENDAPKQIHTRERSAKRKELRTLNLKSLNGTGRDNEDTI